MSVKPATLQLKRGTAEDLAAVNEVLLAGEMCIELDTGMVKIGDGTSTWNELDYAYVSSGSLEHETWTMTLDDDSVITKDVAIWTSQE